MVNPTGLRGLACLALLFLLSATKSWGQTAQTIIFGAPTSNAIFAPASFTVSATASSGLTVSFASTTMGVCTMPGPTIVSTVATGTCTIEATQAGNGAYAAAAPVSQSFTIVQASPSGALMAASGSPFAAGSDPASVAVGDFNGDGKPDLATANYGSNNVTVLLGDGSGGFTAAPGSPFGSGRGPGSVAVGDFNGDGKLDLVAANNTNNNVAVLLGDGSGGFTAAPGSPFVVGSGPASVAVADFNGDGKLDVATASQDSDNVTVLLGDGSGGFTAAPGSPFAAGSAPDSIAVSDFNGDGKLDLATVNYGGTVTVLLGNGSGGFTAAPGSPFTVGIGPVSVAVGDFNGDGKPDLATANGYSDNVTVLLGNGSGGFTAAPGSPFAVGSNPYSVAVGDFNGDGKPDLAAANTSSNSITVLLGDGLAGFTAAPGGSFTVGTNPYAVAVGDFNGDGKLDLVAANYDSSNVTVLLGGVATTSATLSTTAASSITYGTPVPLTLRVGVAVAGIPEEYALSTPSGTATFLDGATTLGTNGPTGSPYTFTPATLAAGTHTLTATYGGDTRNNSSSSNTITITVSKASQTITFGSPPSPAVYNTSFTVGATATSGLPVTFSSATPSECTVSGATVRLIAVGTCTIDADQPGNANYSAALQDRLVFLVTQAPQTITFGFPPSPTVYNSSVTVSATATSGLAVTFSSATPSVCTVSSATATLIAVGTCTINANQAGNANYSAAPQTSQSFTVTQATQTITFEAAAGLKFVGQTLTVAVRASSGLPVSLVSNTLGVCTVSGTTASALAAGTCTVRASQAGNADYNATSATQNFTIVQASPSGALTASPGSPFAVGGEPASVVVGDFNGDGKPDLATANTLSNTVTVLLGDGSGGFTVAPGSPFGVGSGPYVVAGGDFNGDGKLDFATADIGSNDVTVLLGNGSGGFVPAPGSPFAVGSDPYAVAVGDFNGDGKLDLATANPDSNNVTVLLGDGSGGFTAAPGSPFGVGSGPLSVAVGDFNGDGTLDLATGWTSSSLGVEARPQRDHNAGLSHAGPSAGIVGNLTVLLGNGLGGFTAVPGSPFAVGSGPASVAVGDFNGDGKLDLVAANYDTSNVTVLLGGLASTSATLSTTASSSIVYGTAVPLTLTVAIPAANALSTPSGSATFLDGGTTLGSAGQTGSPYTFTPATLSAGAHTLTANYGGDTRNNSSSSNTVKITVTQASQTITFGALSNQTFGAGPFTLSATGGASGNPVVFSSTTPPVCIVKGANVTIAGAGTCTIQANQAGDANYAAAVPVGQTFTVYRASQSITFGVLPNQTFGAGPFTVGAIGGASGNAITLSSATTSVCAVGGVTVTIVGVGTCTIQANQAGNANYSAAPTASQSFTVAPASQTITFPPLPSPQRPTAVLTLTATASSALPVTFSSQTPSICSVSGVSLMLLATGACTVQASQAGNANYLAATAVSQTITVAQASQTITFAQPSSPQNPTDSVALMATASSGLPVTLSSQTPLICSVSGSSAMLIAAGACSIQASQAGNAIYVPAVTVVRSFSFAAVPLTAMPTSLSFNFLPAAGSVPSQSIAVGPSAPSIPYNASASSSWITVNPSSGMTPGSVTVGVNPVGLVPGKTYSGTITIASPFGKPATVTVMLSIDPSAPIVPSVSQIVFPTWTGSPATQSITLNGADGFQVPFTVSFAGAQPTPLSNPPFRREAARDVPPSSFVSFTPSQGTTPAVVNLTTNSLVAGFAYNGTLSITPTASPSMAFSIPVTVTAPAPPLQLTVAPSSVAVTVTQGSQASSSVETETSGGSGATLTYTVAITPAVIGLSASPASGSLAIGGSQPIQILVDATNLAPGSYPSALQVTVTDAANQSQTQLVPVSIIVTPAPSTQQPSRLNLNFQGISFTERAGNGNSVPQTVSVLNTGAGTLNWNAFVAPPAGATQTANWLRISNSTGKSTSSIPSGLTIVLDPVAVGALPVGDYSALVNVVNSDNPGDSQLLTVELVVTDPSMVPPDAIPVPVGLVFTAQNGANPTSQNVTVYTSSSDPVALAAGVEINVSSPWLSVASCGSTDDFSSAMIGTLKPACLTVSVNIAGLAPKVYQGAITLGVQSGMGSPVLRVVAVTLIVASVAAGPSGSTRGASPRAAGQSCVPTELVPTFVGGLPGNFNDYATTTVGIEVQVTDDCGNIVPLPGTLDPTVSVTISSNQQQPMAGTMVNNDPVNSRYTYQFTPSDAANNAIVAVSASRAGLSTGTALGCLCVTGTLNSGAFPTLLSSGISDINSTVDAAYAPGEIIVVYGRNLTVDGGSATPSGGSLPVLDGTQLNITGSANLKSQPLNLLYVGPTQIVAQLPAALTPNNTYQIQAVLHSGPDVSSFTTAESIDVVAVSPVLAANTDGTVIALHANSSLVSSAQPAVPGEQIAIALNGMGFMPPAPSVILDGKGLDPGLVVYAQSGDLGYQVGFIVPSGLTAGAHQLSITENSVPSNTATLLVGSPQATPSTPMAGFPQGAGTTFPPAIEAWPFFSRLRGQPK